MPWLQIQIDCTRDQVERIEDALLEAGAQSVTLQDNADQPIFEPALGETPLWQSTRVIGLFEEDADTEAVEGFLSLATGSWQWQSVADENWERAWMQDFQPIHCGGRLWICPSWTPPPDPEAVNILLDPGLAFGTGTHPTTFLCLNWLSEAPPKGLRVVDFGCGSGILAIACAKLGAGEIMGVDIDPQALLATHENSERNNLPIIPAYLPKDAPTWPADLVLANILAGPLVELAPELTARVKPGGYLCLSGLLDEQIPAVQAAYQDAFDFDPPRTREGWACLVARKKADFDANAPVQQVNSASYR